MLRSTAEILSYRLQARDGQLGKVKDIYFDDARWAVRYFVADTRRWLPGRRVLVLPAFVGEPDWEAGILPVDLTRQRVEGAPRASEDLPVSRAHEVQLARYYLAQPGTAPPFGDPALMGPAAAGGEEVPAEDEEQGNNLRSLREIEGYEVVGEDGGLGQVADLIAESEGWDLRYLVVAAGDWLDEDKQVLVAPAWITNIDWRTRRISTGLRRTQVRAIPGYDPATPINREVETRLYDYLGRPREVVEREHQQGALDQDQDQGQQA